MNIIAYLLIPLILFTILLYPLIRKVISLLEILVNKYIQNTGNRNTSTPTTPILNLKLLAYERIILFIERMKPDSLILRTQTPTLTNREYHQLLLNEIRKEYEYNLSQQLYLSTEAWTITTNFKNNVITLINTAAAACEPQKSSPELAQKILEHYLHSDLKAEQTIQIIKNDIKT